MQGFKCSPGAQTAAVNWRKRFGRAIAIQNVCTENGATLIDCIVTACAAAINRFNIDATLPIAVFGARW
jgi:hypothetical protein